MHVPDLYKEGNPKYMWLDLDDNYDDDDFFLTLVNPSIIIIIHNLI